MGRDLKDVLALVRPGGASPLGLSLACLVIVSLATGCGGGLTQADMMKYARVQSGDEDEEEEQAAPIVVQKKNRRDDDDDDSAVAPYRGPKNNAVEVPEAPGGIVTHAPAADEAVTTLEPESPPEDAVERVAWSMQRIGKAIYGYYQDKRKYPGAAVLTGNGRPLLSWRVQILPYLGYEELYAKFKLDESWDSENNLPLTKQCPAEFQAVADNLADQTRFLGVFGTTSAFGEDRGKSSRDFEDGIKHTAIVLEVESQLAQTWTQPIDFSPNLQNPRLGLGPSFHVVWGDGYVSRITQDAAPHFLRAMFTIDGGEAFNRNEVHHPPGRPKPATIKADDTGSVDLANLANSQTDIVQPGALPSGLSEVPEESFKPRIPKPSDKEIAQASELMHKIYAKEWAAADDDQKKEAFARKLLQDVEKLEGDPAGKYAVLEAARKIATALGRPQTALEATEQLIDTFEVDAVQMQLDTLKTLAQETKRNERQKLLKVAEDVMWRAMATDRYDEALALQGIAANAAKEMRDEESSERLRALRPSIQAMERAFKRMTAFVNNSEELAADDPRGNELGGEFYCLFKSQWERGLTMLAAGPPNSPLVQAAIADLAAPADWQGRIAVADQWWQIASQRRKSAGMSPIEKNNLLGRASFWYSKALEAGPPGLIRIKAEKRVEEIRGQLDATRSPDARQRQAAANRRNDDDDD